MPPPIRPAADARHRRACFSLFRALLRQGRRVPLPDDIATALPPAHPIQALVARIFRKNRKDTSPRLVVSALQNGYRFLALLNAAAQDPPQPARDEVLSFLRTNQSRILAARARNAAIRTPKPAPPPPLLKLVSQDPPIYEPAQQPLPLSAFKSGIRRVPRLDICGIIHPFLRLGSKPQPAKLSKALHHRYKLREDTGILAKKFREEDMDQARQEDRWESQIQRLMMTMSKGQRRPPPDTTTYASTLYGVVGELNEWMRRDYQDAQARGKALWEIVEREKALAKREKDDARRAASRERKARMEAGEEVEPVGAKFARHLEEKRKMWPPVGEVRQRMIDAKAARVAAETGGPAEKV